MILNAVWINDEFFILTIDGFRRFFQTQLMIAATKKTDLKDTAEGSWLKKGKVRTRDVAQEKRSVKA